MTTKEAVPKSTQSKRNPLTSACPTTSATTPLLLVIYRFFIGVFVGADYPIATSLITEFTPKHHRAISMGMVSAAWYLGATVAAVVGFALCDVDGGWRLMFEDEEEEPKHKTGFAEMFSKGYAARIVFWESSRCARSFPCTPSTRSARRS